MGYKRFKNHYNKIDMTLEGLVKSTRNLYEDILLFEKAQPRKYKGSKITLVAAQMLLKYRDTTVAEKLLGYIIENSSIMNNGDAVYEIKQGSKKRCIKAIKTTAVQYRIAFNELIKMKALVLFPNKNKRLHWYTLAHDFSALCPR